MFPYQVHVACRRAAARAGFTLVELLVVIAIIAVLLGLLLPAVQAAREAGRRTSCGNNLHQIGIAMLGYHDVNGGFPVGCTEPRIYSWDTTKRQLAWSAFLLPYLEEQVIHDQINFGKPFDHKDNAPAAAHVVPAYVCSSAPHDSLLRGGRAVCDYGGIYGERICGPNNPPKGVMLFNRAVSISEISDGTTCTLMVSEDSFAPDGQWINGQNIFDVSCAINAALPIENDIRSRHPRGAHGLFCDGSVRFLRDDMALDALAAICTRAGGEPPSGF